MPTRCVFWFVKKKKKCSAKLISFSTNFPSSNKLEKDHHPVQDTETHPPTPPSAPESSAPDSTPPIPIPPPPEDVPAPPPPPPPIGAPPLPNMAAKQKKHPKTNIKLKGLYWSRVPNVNIPNYWEHDIKDEDVPIPVSEIESFFPAEVHKENQENSQESPEQSKSEQKPAVINLIDVRRSNNIGLFV